MTGGAVAIAKRAMRLMLAVTMTQMVTQAAAPAAAETLIVQGSTTFNRRIMEPFRAEIERAAGYDLTIIPNKSTPGLVGLMEGRAHLGMISAPLRTEIDILRQVAPGMAYDLLREFWPEISHKFKLPFRVEPEPATEDIDLNLPIN